MQTGFKVIQYCFFFRFYKKVNGHFPSPFLPNFKTVHQNITEGLYVVFENNILICNENQKKLYQGLRTVRNKFIHLYFQYYYNIEKKIN